jgi:hypothetical protein
MDRFLLALCVTAFVVLAPASAAAQATITGVVTDASGGVLPGVTVEAESPALIERVRTTVTDGAGQYRIIDLRPGLYTVRFTLTGFSGVARQGVELAGSFVATVNAELRVGSFEETITVSGESPIVDVERVTQQRVMDREVIDSIPVGRQHASLAVLIPGVVSNAQDVGGSSNLGFVVMTIHGNRSSDQRVMVDGFTIRNVAAQGQNANILPDMGSTQEVAIDYAAGNAELMSSGLKIDYIPKTGGNAFTGSFFATGANSRFQGDNYSSDLEQRGLREPNSLKMTYDINGSGGGPILRDKLWFFGSTRFQANETYVAGLYENLNAGDPTRWDYAPDYSHQAVYFLRQPGGNARLTWQASPKNKIGFFFERQGRRWHVLNPTSAPEAATLLEFPKNEIATTSWTSTLSNRLLLDARAAMQSEIYQEHRPPAGDVIWSLIPVTEQGGIIPGLLYRAPGALGVGGTRFFRASMPNMVNVATSLSYATGAHSLKVGFANMWGRRNLTQVDNFSSVSYRFRDGIPNLISQRATPSEQSDVLKGEMGIYVQDRWKVGRATVNGGLRLDYFGTYFPEQHLGPATLIPARNLTFPKTDWYSFKDLSPRLGLAYDLRGDGKTAAKVSLGRFVNAGNPTIGNPVANLANSVTRSWTDGNRDYIPNCDLLNPQANGECGIISDLRFGQPIPSVSYDPDTLVGWGKRQYNWEFSTGIQHALHPKVGLDVGYFRRWYGNFTVTDNRALSATDSDPFSVTAPSDPRLPGGGGYVVDGFYNVNPSRIGLVDNYITFSDNFGKQIEHWNGADVTVNARPGQGITFQGGLSTGRTTTDNCEIRSALPEISPLDAFCSVQTKFLTQVKLLGTYAIPRVNVNVAATFQSLPGPQVTASYVATNAAVQPSLGRPLSGGLANVTVNVVEPGTMYGERLNQFDLRFSKALQARGLRTVVNFDLYNALNGNTVLSHNNNYASWLTPQSILDARLAKFSVQLDF